MEVKHFVQDVSIVNWYRPFLLPLLLPFLLPLLLPFILPNSQFSIPNYQLSTINCQLSTIMIEYIRGILDELTPTQATIEAHGVGYILNISLNTYTALQGKSEARLFVYESIREDAWTLYGFATKQERELFLMLISVSGVGGNTARTMLSSFSAPELAGLIMDGNERMLKTVKGLGAKTAQRIIVELRDKVVSLGIEAVSPSGDNAAPSLQNNEIYNEACEALKMLGFPPAPVAKTVKAILKDEPSAPVEKVIKLALKML